MIANLGIVDTKKIIAAIQQSFGVDMADYTLTTLRRRLVEVLQKLNISSVDDFVTQLENNNVRYDDFSDLMMIDTTEIFRDPSAWREIREKLIPDIVKTPGSRIWLPAVSSGEELFSLMIVLHEMGVAKDVRVVASCASTKRIDRIKRGGGYLMKKIEVGEANYTRLSGKFEFNKYYNVEDKLAYLDPSLIENVEFNNFNISQEKAEHTYRLIICRNILIQYNLPLSEKVLSKLIDNLTVAGHLVIGNKETLEHSEVGKRMQIVDESEKIYKRRV